MSQSFNCPVCGKPYDNYREYFGCWTMHLQQKYTGHDDGGVSSVIPTEHGQAVKWLKNHPQYIEEGMATIESEIGVFRGRIDLICVDKERRLVLVDVDNGHDINRKIEQLRKYKRNLQWMASHIFRLNYPNMPSIRLFIVNPNHFIKDVTNMIAKKR